MKILLASDSHGNNEALDTLAKKYPNMDFYLHLGDSEADEFSIMPFVSVAGNCDFYPNFESFLVIPTPLGNIFACHSPFISKSELKNHEAKFFIHGHTHRRAHLKNKDCIEINPGSISFPRDGHDLSYAILTIEKDKYELEFYSL